MSVSRPDMIEQLAKDYADYAKVDLSSQMKTIHDVVEDLMMRLEEVESIVGMVQMENAECISGHIPTLQTLRPELIKLFKRIDALENIVARANTDLSALENAVDNAEAEFGVTDKLFGILNPLSFFKKPQEPVITNRLPTYEAPTIFRADDYFEKQ